MQRDMELARNILFQMESSNKTLRWASIDLPDKSKDEISYHIQLLSEAGLINADDVNDSIGLALKAENITRDGYKFLESTRNNSDWEKAKQYIISQGFTVTLKSLKIGLSILLQKKLGPK